MQTVAKYSSKSTALTEADKHVGVFQKIAAYFKARSRAKSITRGLKEVEDIKSGKIKARSFEQSIIDL
jgi:hypothetical protein